MNLTHYIHALFEIVDKKDIPNEIDLVLDGGAFNGAYLLGALYYLKEMEKKQLLSINRISGCSVGACGAILYLSKIHLWFGSKMRKPPLN